MCDGANLQSRYGVFLVTITLATCLVNSQEPKWTVGYLDPFGAVPSSYALPATLSTTQARALADLKSGKAEQAWAGFKILYQRDDADPLHIWGVMLAAQYSGRLPEAIELVASRVNAVRERTLARGDRNPFRASGPHLAAFCLGLAMVGDDRSRARPLGPLGARWLATMTSQTFPTSTKDKRTILLYSTAMHVLRQPGKARPPLARLVSRFPDDARLHYVLSRLYSEGAVKVIERGKEVPVPHSERVDSAAATRHALLAAKLEPGWADARFEAGLMLVSTDVGAAKEHFRAYLKLATPTPRRKAVIDAFLRTGVWGPPPK